MDPRPAIGVGAIATPREYVPRVGVEWTPPETRAGGVGGAKLDTEPANARDDQEIGLAFGDITPSMSPAGTAPVPSKAAYPARWRWPKTRPAELWHWHGLLQHPAL